MYKVPSLEKRQTFVTFLYCSTPNALILLVFLKLVYRWQAIQISVPCSFLTQDPYMLVSQLVRRTWGGVRDLNDEDPN